jgi:hypothetical protein
MSPQGSRRLWVFLEGDGRPHYLTDIPIDATVSQLKAEIKGKIKNLDDTDVDDLNLWKVISLLPGACTF